MSLSTKPCKWCYEVSPLHWPYQCHSRPIQASKTRMNNPRRLCKWCASTSHPSSACFKRTRKQIKQVSDKAQVGYRAMRKLWFEYNPPDENNEWICYLQIAPECPMKITYEYLTLEHVIPKVKAPELKFVYTNIRPSCAPCNRVKGSRTIEQLSIIYPHLRTLL